MSDEAAERPVDESPAGDGYRPERADRDALLRQHVLMRSALAVVVLVAACSSGGSDEGRSTAVTTLLPPHRTLMSSIVERLDCEFTDAGDYEAVGGEAGRGVDCWIPEGQLRIHVYDSAADLLSPSDPFSMAIHPDGLFSTPGLRGDKWVIVAENREVAAIAQDRLGGEFITAGPPASYVFPSDIPEDARRRAQPLSTDAVSSTAPQ